MTIIVFLKRVIKLSESYFYSIDHVEIDMDVRSSFPSISNEIPAAPACMVPTQSFLAHINSTTFSNHEQEVSFQQAQSLVARFFQFIGAYPKIFSIGSSETCEVPSDCKKPTPVNSFHPNSYRIPGFAFLAAQYLC